MAADDISEKFIRRAAAGFLFGILIGNLLTAFPDLISGVKPGWVTDHLIQKTGSVAGAMAVQSLFSGIFGAVGMGGMIFYDIGSWSMLKAALIHYLLILTVFIPGSLFLGWCTPTADSVMLMAGIIGTVYAGIWLILFLSYRRQVAEINSMKENTQPAPRDQ